MTVLTAPLGNAELAALATKYARLVKLRGARDQVSENDPGLRTTLRELSRQFPGCLRELDLLSLAALEQRLAVVEAATTGAPVPAWLHWIWAYHSLLGAALWLRASTNKTTSHNDPDGQLLTPRQLVRALATQFSIDVDEAFVRNAAHPPGGKLSPLVLAHLANLFQQPIEILRTTLFPPRRPHRP